MKKSYTVGAVLLTIAVVFAALLVIVGKLGLDQSRLASSAVDTPDMTYCTSTWLTDNKAAYTTAKTAHDASKKKIDGWQSSISKKNASIKNLSKDSTVDDSLVRIANPEVYNKMCGTITERNRELCAQAKKYQDGSVVNAKEIKALKDDVADLKKKIKDEQKAGEANKATVVKYEGCVDYLTKVTVAHFKLPNETLDTTTNQGTISLLNTDINKVSDVYGVELSVPTGLVAVLNTVKFDIALVPGEISLRTLTLREQDTPANVYECELNDSRTRVVCDAPTAKNATLFTLTGGTAKKFILSLKPIKVDKDGSFTIQGIAKEGITFNKDSKDIVTPTVTPVKVNYKK